MRSSLSRRTTTREADPEVILLPTSGFSSTASEAALSRTSEESTAQMAQQCQREFLITYCFTFRRTKRIIPEHAGPRTVRLAPLLEACRSLGRCRISPIGTDPIRDSRFTNSQCRARPGRAHLCRRWRVPRSRGPGPSPVTDRARAPARSRQPLGCGRCSEQQRSIPSRLPLGHSFAQPPRPHRGTAETHWTAARHWLETSVARGDRDGDKLERATALHKRSAAEHRCRRGPIGPPADHHC